MAYQQRPYQANAVSNIQKLFNTSPKVVLAACPGSGKTWMSYDIIRGYLKKNPKARILVLTHGQTILRTQYASQYEEYCDAKFKGKKPFTMEVVENKTNLINSKAQVVVALPHTVKNVSKLPKFDMLLVDEAHQFYFGQKMVQNIIKKCKPKHQLLLTGTPSRFIYENQKAKKEEFKIYPIAMEEVIDAGVTANIVIELASTSLNIFNSDYNRDGNLQKKHFNKMAVNLNQTMDDLLLMMLDKLCSVVRAKPKAYAKKLEYTPAKILKWDWLRLLGNLKKTMIACPSIDVAQKTAKFFENKLGKEKISISESENDKDCTQIAEFMRDDEKLILIVVDRGILGFNMPELCTVIDMTGSRNIDRISQLMNRVARKSKNNPKMEKLFFKVVPTSLAEYFAHILMATVCLMDIRWLMSYNGKNFNQLEIPVFLKGKNKRGKKSTEKKGKKPQKRFYEYVGIPDLASFKHLYHSDGSLLNSYRYAKLEDIREELNILDKKIAWSIEESREEAKKYETRVAFAVSSNAAYNCLLKNDSDYLDNLFPLKKNKNRTLEEGLEEIKKFKSRVELNKRGPGLYSWFLKNYPEELDKIFPKTRNFNRTLGQAVEEAKQYKSRKEFKKIRQTVYNWFLKNNRKKLDEIFPRICN